MNPLVAILVVIVGGFILLVLPPLLAGWGRLSRAYPPVLALPVNSPNTVTPYVGLPCFAAWVGVGTSKDGIYFEPAFPASVFMAPVFLPWAELAERDAGL